MGQSRVLIINNNQIDTRFIGSYLRSKEFEVDLAEKIAEAFNLMIRELPDLILLNTSGGEGTGFCRKIRQYTDIPIIILSANPQKYEELKCLESGADDFIIKPFSVEILALKVMALLRRRKSSTLINTGQDELQLTINLN
jgi:DNA-binding response OmpR family regulator